MSPAEEQADLQPVSAGGIDTRWAEVRVFINLSDHCSLVAGLYLSGFYTLVRSRHRVVTALRYALCLHSFPPALLALIRPPLDLP